MNTQKHKDDVRNNEAHKTNILLLRIFPLFLTYPLSLLDLIDFGIKTTFTNSNVKFVIQCITST